MAKHANHYNTMAGIRRMKSQITAPYRAVHTMAPLHQRTPIKVAKTPFWGVQPSGVGK